MFITVFTRACNGILHCARWIHSPQLPSYFFKIHFGIIHPSWYFKWLLWTLPVKFCMHNEFPVVPPCVAHLLLDSFPTSIQAWSLSGTVSIWMHRVGVGSSGPWWCSPRRAPIQAGRWTPYWTGLGWNASLVGVALGEESENISYTVGATTLHILQSLNTIYNKLQC